MTIRTIFFLLVILILVAGSGFVLLVTGNKVIKIICWFILCFIAIGSLSIWWGRERETIAMEQEDIGIYELAVTESIMIGYNSVLYREMTIKLYENHTFLISRDVNFLPGSRGTWKLINNKDGPYEEFHFSDTDVNEHSVVRFGIGGDELAIESPPSKSDYPVVKILKFSRIP